MKLVQIGAGSKSKNVMDVDDNIFAELIDVNDAYMTFQVTYSITPENDPNSAYDRVEITIDKKDVSSEISEVPGLERYSPDTDGSSTFKSNGPRDITKFALAQVPGSRSKSYPYETAKKVFAGRMLLDSLNNRKKKIGKIISYFGQNFETLRKTNYSTIELLQLPVKTTINNTYSISKRDFDPRSLSDIVNSYKYDITSPVSEDTNSDKRLSGHISSNSEHNKRIVHEKLLQYYMLGIPDSPSAKNHIHYGKLKKIKKLQNFSFFEKIKIPVINKNENLTVTFVLYKRDEKVPSETIKKELNVSTHYSAYSIKNIYPRCMATYENGVANLSISINDTSGISQLNIYKKEIFSSGEVGTYTLVSSLPAQSHISHKISLGEGLYALRVMPVDLLGNETGCYENVITGESYTSIGSLSIFPHYPSSSDKIVIEIFNIPSGTTKIFLYRRDCTQNPYEPFSLVSEISGFSEVSNYRIIDSAGVEPGNIFEYYVSVLVTNDRIANKKISSNYCFLRHPLPNFQKKAINVNLKSFKAATNPDTNEYTVSFQLSTDFSKEEKEFITNILKDQIGEILTGELYSIYLDPANNSSSPIGDGKYADLILHEVVRTNLNTGERSTFKMFKDGDFVDNRNSQSVVRANALNPKHTYVYQIFSYKKDPILLFRDYIAYGTNSNGREWFYSPYKWKQPKVIATGKLFPDDNTGKPIIDTYESLTSEPLGLTATKIFTGVESSIQVHDVVAERVDRNTTMIRWNSSSVGSLDITQAKIDGFVVMKVVNGIRSFVGKTTKNFIYHELSEEDLGTLYYIVIPIEDDFSFGLQDYSNAIFIDSKGIVSENPTNAGALNV